MGNDGFLMCSKCGKKLIRRRKNGLFSFAFGRWAGTDKIIVDGKEIFLGPTVKLEVFGSLKIQCIRRSCREKHPDHWNVFNFFPSQEEKVIQSAVE